MIDTVDLEAVAEGDAHAAWIMEHHVGNGTERPRCVVCDTWWPCNEASLGALAVLRAREAERLRAALKDARRLVVYHHDTRSMRKLQNGVPCPVCRGPAFDDAPALRAAIDAALAE